MPKHTRDNQSLAAHDEDDLHRTETAEPQRSPLDQGRCQLDHEDGAKPADADRCRDVGRTLQPLKLGQVVERDNVASILDGESEAETDGQESDQVGEHENGFTMQFPERNTDNADL